MSPMYFFFFLLLQINIDFLLGSVAYHVFSARILFFCLSILSERQKWDEAQWYHKVEKRKRGGGVGETCMESNSQVFASHFCLEQNMFLPAKNVQLLAKIIANGQKFVTTGVPYVHLQKKKKWSITFFW